MAKLYFRHGPVTAAKTMNLIAVAENYERQGKRAAIVAALPPDTKSLPTHVKSRCGISKKIDVYATSSWTDILSLRDAASDSRCILVDEAQFLSAKNVDALRDLTYTHSIPVICYGLRTDLRRQLFEGSRRLFEVADSIEEIKTTCARCDRKAIFNMKIDGDEATQDGPSIDVRDVYIPTCYGCFRQANLTNKTSK